MAEGDYLNKIKELIATNNIDLGNKSIEEFVGKIASVDFEKIQFSKTEGQNGVSFQVGDIQIVSNPGGGLSVTEKKEPTPSTQNGLVDSQYASEQVKQEPEHVKQEPQSSSQTTSDSSTISKDKDAEEEDENER